MNDIKPQTQDLNLAIAESYKILRNSKQITITTHVNPDGDAIGSELALYFYAVSLGIKSKIINCSETPYNMLFLKGSNKVELFDESKHIEYIESSDTIFIVDLNNSRRVESMEKTILNAKGKKVIIDHHIEPDNFGDVYVIDSDSTSTGELIWKILKKDLKFIITQEMATALYAAIMTDTGSFRFPRTDNETHRIIAELIECGADPVLIYEEIYNNIPFKAARLMGEALSGMELFYGGKLAVMVISHENFTKTGASEDDSEDIVERSVMIKGVKAGIMLIERPDNNEIRISFRSKGDINVRELAVSLGGGGHHHAAGARIANISLDQARKIVIEKTKKLFE
jgi:phosphoesterase RecJ-like protein